MSKARDLADGTFDTDTLVVDAANNRVGVGTATPSAPLQIAADSNTLSLRISGRSSDDRSDVEFYENDNTTKLTSLTNEQTYSIWSYGTRSIYTDSNTHIFRNGSATTLARLDSDGLKFNSDTAAANALDDYEEGTWTPVIKGTTSAGTGTYSQQKGRYAKIGQVVYFQAYIVWSAHSGASGIMAIGGLPYTPNAGSGYYGAATIGYIRYVDWGGNIPNLHIHPSVDEIYLGNSTNNGTWAAAGVDTSGDMIISGHYYVT